MKMFGFGHKKEVSVTPVEAATDAPQSEWNEFAKTAEDNKDLTEPKIGVPETTVEGENSPAVHALGETAVSAEQAPTAATTETPLAELPAVASPEAPAEEQDAPSEQNTAA